MIKLTRPDAPKELKDAETHLCEQYKKGLEQKKKIAVWSQSYIKDALYKMSHRKCAYCESYIDIDNDGEIEHFYCRHIYPEKVVCWDNLLLVCHRCNSSKSAHDCSAEPIINPTIDDPKEYLIYKNCRLYSRDHSVKGLCTIAYLKLDRTDRWYKIYGHICDDIEKRINGCFDKLTVMSYNVQPIHRVQLKNAVIDLFNLSQTDNQYSAIYATEILTNVHYEELKKKLKKAKIWNQQIKNLEKHAQSISLA